tara:strand:+ start:37 stop:993 length:957 start_codon:yes stop_codon:yes gene_type:complete
MADFTGQNIQDTYQSLLQVSSSGQVTDGTGSILPIKFNGPDLIVSGAIRAQSYIISQSILNISSGSTAFGDTVDDSHTFIGTITASGNIKTGGNFYVSQLGKILNTSQNNTFIQFNEGQILAQTAGNEQVRFTSGVGTVFNESGIVSNDFRVESKDDQHTFYIDSGLNSIELGRNTTTHVTASGNISSSGNLSSSGLYVEGEGNFIGNATENESYTGTQLAVGGASGANIKIYSQHPSTNRDVGLHMSASSNGQEYSIGLVRDRNTFFISPSDVLTGPESSVFEIDAVGNITASLNISASGTITAASSNIVTIDGGSW